MKEPSEIRYIRNGDMVRLRLRGLTNHELREVLVGLWGRLDADDREDHIRELTHYHTVEGAFFSPLARVIRDGESLGATVEAEPIRREEHEA